MIVKKITSDYEFYNWLRNSDNYRDKFSTEGAMTIQKYYDDLSESIDEDIEFEPVGWCCEWSEYDNLLEFNTEYWGEGKNENWFSLDELKEQTEVLELSGGRLIVLNF